MEPLEHVHLLNFLADRHEGTVPWLSSFAEAHEGHRPVGFVLRCIDARIHRFADHDIISKVTNYFLEHRNMGNVANDWDYTLMAGLEYFSKHLDENLKHWGFKKGFVLVEGHTDCGAVRLVHSGEGMSHSLSVALSQINDAVLEAYKLFAEDPERLDDLVGDIVDDIFIGAKIAIGERFNEKIFSNSAVRNILRRTINPTRYALALHVYIVILNARNSLMKILKKLGDLWMSRKIEAYFALYDIFTAKTYFYTVDPVTGKPSERPISV